MQALVAVAAATAIAIGSVVAVELSAESGREPADQPTPTAPAIMGSQPVWGTTDGVLVGDTFLASGTTSWEGPTLTHAGVVYADREGVVFSQAPGEAARRIGTTSFGVTGDPKSSVAAWFDEAGAGSRELVVYDVEAERELARVTVEQPVSAGDPYSGSEFEVIAAVTDGVVYFHGPLHLFRFAWERDEAPRVVRDRMQILDVAAGVTARTDGDLTLFGRDGGRPVVALERLDPSGSLSADGNYFAGSVDRRPVLVDTGTGRVRPVSLDPRQSADGFGWAFGETLMILTMSRPPVGGQYIDSARGLLLSCTAATGTCREEKSYVQSLPIQAGDTSRIPLLPNS